MLTHTLVSRLSNFKSSASALGIFLYPPHFYASILQTHLPVGHPDRPAKCLTFAVYLWAVRLASSPSSISAEPDTVPLIASNADLQKMEEDFMHAATAETAIALSSSFILHSSSDAVTHSQTPTRQCSHPQIVLHTIQAEVLLATYFFSLGRFLEGKYHVANAVGIVVGSGLHLGAGLDDEDVIQRAERINAAWAVLNLDRAWAIALDSEPNFPRGSRVNLPWPVDLDNNVDVAHIQEALSENHVANDTIYDSLSFFDEGRGSGGGSDVAAQSGAEHFLALESKAVFVWDRVAAYIKELDRGIGVNADAGQSRAAYAHLSGLLDEVQRQLDIHSSTSNASIKDRTRILLVRSILGAAAIHLNRGLDYMSTRHTTAHGDSDETIFDSLFDVEPNINAAVEGMDMNIEKLRANRIEGARAVLGALLALYPDHEDPLEEGLRNMKPWPNPVIGVRSFILSYLLSWYSLRCQATWIEASQAVIDEVVALRLKEGLVGEQTRAAPTSSTSTSTSTSVYFPDAAAVDLLSLMHLSTNAMKQFADRGIPLLGEYLHFPV